MHYALCNYCKNVVINYDSFISVKVILGHERTPCEPTQESSHALGLLFLHQDWAHTGVP